MPTLKDKNAEVHYIINRVNKKPFLFFIHGAGSNHTIYKPLFNKKTNYIAIDIRHHGHSKGGKVNFNTIVQDIENIRTKEKLNKLILVGNCLGASLAVEYYKQFPKNVQKLILLTLFSERYVRFSFIFHPLASFFTMIFNLFPARKNTIFQDYHKYQKRPMWYYPMLDVRGTPLKALASLVKELFEYKIDLNIKVPTIIITAEHDIMTRNTLLKEDAKKYNLTIKELHSNHVPLTRMPEEIKKIIEDIL
jgi:pimeloyl-ACP methyl ester carboxylesterase